MALNIRSKLGEKLAGLTAEGLTNLQDWIILSTARAIFPTTGLSSNILAAQRQVRSRRKGEGKKINNFYKICSLAIWDHSDGRVPVKRLESKYLEMQGVKEWFCCCRCCCVREVSQYTDLLHGWPSNRKGTSQGIQGEDTKKKKEVLGVRLVALRKRTNKQKVLHFPNVWTEPTQRGVSQQKSSSPNTNKPRPTSQSIEKVMFLQVGCRRGTFKQSLNFKRKTRVLRMNSQ